MTESKDSSLEIKMVTAKTFDDFREVIDLVKTGRTVLLDLEGTSEEIKKEIMDCMRDAYSTKDEYSPENDRGTFAAVGNQGTFIITPPNIYTL